MYLVYSMTEKITSFTDLKVWQQAHRLVLAIYKITKVFPRDEQFGLTNQMRRAVVSISSNIAEGFSKRTAIDKNKFYNIAQGSLTELQNQLLISKDVGYLDVRTFQELASQTIIVNKMLYGILKSSCNKILNTKYYIHILCTN